MARKKNINNEINNESNTLNTIAVAIEQHTTHCKGGQHSSYNRRD
tara:strand:+ start:1046 stop:1180 length:135 start_codon:yes stop_codon:yes gene_type:complete